MSPPVETEDKPDADGITETMLEFSWERDVQPQVSLDILFIPATALVAVGTGASRLDGAFRGS